MSKGKGEGKRTIVRINVWSPPRCLSTALMYSFAQRPDAEVHDEPLYAHFLQLHDEATAPRSYRDMVLAAQCTDGEAVVERLMAGPVSDLATRVVMMKHMAKQLRGLSTSSINKLLKCRNVLLIRDPIELLPSHNANVPASLEESGFVDMANIFSLIRRNGETPIVVDAALLRQRPEAVLRELCAALDIPFCSQMLSWPKGPKPYDGCWAHVWYQSVHKSTGFNAHADGSSQWLQGSLRQFPPDLMGPLRECLPFYSLLRPYAITGVDFSASGGGGGGGGGCAPLAANGLNSGGSSATGESADGSAFARIEPRNRDILVWVRGRLLPREMACLSVFDSAVQGGDAVWEGLRVYKGRVFRLEKHLQRLQDSAKALAFQNVPSDDDICHALFSTLAANGMHDGAHVRMTLTRGEKTTSSMNPMFNTSGCSLVVLAEWKPVGSITTYPPTVKVVTATTRRNSPLCLDSKIHHNNLLNNILAKIEANNAGAADAIMLDLDGMVAETNATNLFMVKRGVLYTPTTDACLPGITREVVMELAPAIGLQVVERRLSLAEFHSADEIFTTGTMGELTSVREIDGRPVGGGANAAPGPITASIQRAFHELVEAEGEREMSKLEQRYAIPEPEPPSPPPPPRG